MQIKDKLIMFAALLSILGLVWYASATDTQLIQECGVNVSC